MRIFHIIYNCYSHNEGKSPVREYLTMAESRRVAEIKVRDMERGAKVNVMKIKTFDPHNLINNCDEETNEVEYVYT